MEILGCFAKTFDSDRKAMKILIHEVTSLNV